MGKIAGIQEEKKMNTQSGKDGSNSEGGDIRRRKVSDDPVLTAGGVMGADEDPRFRPVSEPDRYVDPDDLGSAPTIAAR
jgi:hypothetical protein